VLGEIGAADVPRLTVLNKIDASQLPAGVERDAHGTIASVRLSASTGAGCADFLAALAERFPSGAVYADDAAAAHS
jgi:GTP-binding protein HflX